ncbi:MAG: nucleoside transporter C-terminal domain-containing protein [candidate division KSB1 bacterium]|nr:nucleoside transporter C-terminal domain-containing protein [candidate division KSB1 bacterium]
MLYYWNIMPRIIRGFAYVFTRFMRISGAESLAAASNIFVGIESALTIRPYLNDMTRSELCTILTAGMATVASNVLAIYVFSLQSQFPTIAGHLISASILSAPAALIMSKLLLPETESPKTLGEHVQVHYEKERSLFDAIMNGANTGVKLIVGIAALLIAILGLVALLDLVLGGVGSKLNALLGMHIDWTLKGLLGYVGLPFALIMGVPPADALEIGRLIGERVVLTEVVSYQDLAVMLQQGVLQHPRSAMIATYALCGFAHVSSMAIFVGGVAALAPARSHDLGQVALRALFAATLATFMTACVAGTFYSSGMVPVGQ